VSGRWQHKVVEVPVKLFGGSLAERIQAELDRLGPLGWELVAVSQASPVDAMRLFLKKEA
jgi:hypothetical protein